MNSSFCIDLMPQQRADADLQRSTEVRYPTRFLLKRGLVVEVCIADENVVLKRHCEFRRKDFVVLLFEMSLADAWSGNHRTSFA